MRSFPRGSTHGEPVFSVLAHERFALGIETIYEGYLVHYGRSRVFATGDPDAALLLGDYLYAHGLVRIAETGDVRAVHDLAELISLCAQGRAEGRDGDAAAWAATTALLGRDGWRGRAPRCATMATRAAGASSPVGGGRGGGRGGREATQQLSAPSRRAA